MTDSIEITNKEAYLEASIQKDSLSIIAINLLLISTIFNGITFEIFGVVSLFILLYKNVHIAKENYRFNKLYKMELRLNLYVLIGVLLYFVLQIFVLRLNIQQITRLYGITKTVFAFPIIWVCMRNLIANGLGISSILPVIILMNYMNFVYMLSNIDIFNFFNGSVNYVGAVDLILFPFVMSWDKKVGSLQRVLFIISFILIVVFSGSRSVLLVSCIMLFGMMLLETDRRRKKLFLAIVIAAAVLMTIALLTGNEMVMRAVSAFTNRSDAARNQLAILAELQYSFYPKLNQLLGSANNLVVSQQKPVHNFVWELLLTYGKIGIILWSIWMLLLGAVLFVYSKERKRIILLSICWLLINYVQPFMTTGFLSQIVVSMEILQLFLRGIAK